MIRSSALLITTALALLATGVFASSLELVYISIGISILAALVLCAGVVLRRGELFGTAGMARQGGSADWPPADVTGLPAMVGGRTRAGGDRETGDRETGDLASARPAKGGPGKAGPGVARRTGEHSAGRAVGGTRPPRSPANGRESAGREPAVAGSTDGELGWPHRTDRERAGSGADREEAAPGRRDHAAAWEDRDVAAPGRRESGRADRREAAPARDGDQVAAAWDDHDAAAPSRPPGFRVPPFGDRPAMTPADQPERGTPVRRPGDSRGPGAQPHREAPAPVPGSAGQGPPVGDGLWDRVSEERADNGRHDPVRPAWPATAGPRAMGTGSAAKQPPAEPRDSRLEPPGPPGGFRLAEPPVPEQEPAPGPEREQDRGEQPAAAGSGAGRGLFEPLVAGKLPPPETERRRAKDAGQAGVDEAAEVSGPPAAEAGPADGTRAGAEDAGKASGTDAAGGAAAAVAGSKPPVADERDEEPAEKPGKQSGGGREARGRDKQSGGGREARGRDKQSGGGREARGRDKQSGGGREARGRDEQSADEADGSAATPLDGEVTIVPGVSRYHRRGCILIRFLSDGDLETMTRGAAEAAGSVPCKACQPDKAVSGH